MKDTKKKKSTKKPEEKKDVYPPDPMSMFLPKGFSLGNGSSLADKFAEQINKDLENRRKKG